MTAAISPTRVHPSFMSSTLNGVAFMRRENPSAQAESVREEMAQRVLWAAWPPLPGETQEHMLARWARRVGLLPSRVKRIRYRGVKIIPAHEADDIRAATGCLKALRERQARLEAATQVRAQDQLDLPLVGGSVSRHR